MMSGVCVPVLMSEKSALAPHLVKRTPAGAEIGWVGVQSMACLCVVGLAPAMIGRRRGQSNRLENSFDHDPQIATARKEK